MHRSDVSALDIKQRVLMLEFRSILPGLLCPVVHVIHVVFGHFSVASIMRQNHVALPKKCPFQAGQQQHLPKMASTERRGAYMQRGRAQLYRLSRRIDQGANHPVAQQFAQSVQENQNRSGRGSENWNEDIYSSHTDCSLPAAQPEGDITGLNADDKALATRYRLSDTVKHCSCSLPLRVAHLQERPLYQVILWHICTTQTAVSQ